MYLPSSICQCIHLEVLSLRNCPIERLPSEIKNLSKLKTLFLES